ncbi:MAG: SBBP repeat-containing protein [Candidatus Hodarchaeales archaeon]|jgi:hypothetical protein
MKFKTLLPFLFFCLVFLTLEGSIYPKNIEKISSDPNNLNSLDFKEISGLFEIDYKNTQLSGHSLHFSSYLGGADHDDINSIQSDHLGNFLIAGSTQSIDFPITNAYSNLNNGGGDAFVTKVGLNGQIIFSTFLGGSSSDLIFDDGIAIDNNNNIIVSGNTDSNDFPKVNPFTTENSVGSNRFISKFTPNGQIIFSTFLRGLETSWFGSRRLGIDNLGNVIICGQMNQPNVSTLNAYDSSYNGGADWYLVKLSPTGEEIFSTYFGGSGEDISPEVTVDTEGNIIFMGKTYSNDLPLVNPIDNTSDQIGGEIFLAKFSPDGKTLLFSSYLGGSNDDTGSFIDADGDKSIYVAGTTNSQNFPTKNGHIESLNGFNDAFVTKLSSNGQLEYSTYLGGSQEDFLEGGIIDIEDNIIVYGQTESPDFPISNAYDPTYNGNNDIFATKINSNGDLEYSTYYGRYGDVSLDGTAINRVGSIFFSESRNNKATISALTANGQVSVFFPVYNYPESINVFNMVVDDTNNVYISGHTNLVNFRTRNAFDSTFGGGEQRDGYIMKFTQFNFENDDDKDGIDDTWEEEQGLDPTINDANGDLDNDGMPNIWEYLMGTLVDVNDAQEDKDGDGMPNIWEYQMGLRADINDADEDKDEDEMPNLWEYQMGLNATSKDGDKDKDWDLVINYMEYRSGTDATNIWSVPIFYNGFPFICISIVHILFIAITMSSGIMGGLTGRYIQISIRKKLIEKTGAPDYKTAELIEKGKFPDYETWKKAQEMDITNYEEYRFTLEQMELEKEEKGVK